jgi:hypothetical protein
VKVAHKMCRRILSVIKNENALLNQLQQHKKIKKYISFKTQLRFYDATAKHWW